LFFLAVIVCPQLAVFAQTITAYPPPPPSDQQLLIQSRPLVATEGAWQIYSDYIRLAPGQDQRKLVLTFINGADGRPKLTDMRVDVGGQFFASLKDFDANGTLSRDVSGKLPAGRTLVAVEVYGPSGAWLRWTLTTPKVTIASVDPNPFTAITNLTIQGTNFSTRPHGNKVMIGNKTVKVTNATSSTLQLQLSPNLSGGEQDMVVSADSILSNPFKVNVMAAPVIKSVNLFSAPPGNPVTVYGKNFASSGNVVMLGNLNAQVVSATANSITFIIPNMNYPVYHLPVKVTSNGMQSKGHVYFNVDIRYIPFGSIRM
jgi:hypothetical protein